MLLLSAISYFPALMLLPAAAPPEPAWLRLDKVSMVCIVLWMENGCSHQGKKRFWSSDRDLFKRNA